MKNIKSTYYHTQGLLWTTYMNNYKFILWSFIVNCTNRNDVQ